MLSAKADSLVLTQIRRHDLSSIFVCNEYLDGEETTNLLDYISFWKMILHGEAMGSRRNGVGKQDAEEERDAL